MEHLLKILAQHWPLRLLSATMLGPLLGMLYLVFFGGHTLHQPRVTAGPKPPMRISSAGRLIS